MYAEAFKKVIYSVLSIILSAMTLVPNVYGQSDVNKEVGFAENANQDILSKKDIIFIGETTHGEPQPWIFTRNLLCDVGHKIDFIGLEMDTETARALKAGELMAENVGIISGQSGNKVSAKIFNEILEIIRKLNVQRKRLQLGEIKVLGLDSSKDIDVKESFRSRDVIMADKIAQAGERGIVHMGAAHTGKAPFYWPKEIHEYIPNLIPISLPAGMLTQRIRPINSIHLIVGGKLDIKKNIKFIAKEWLPFWDFVNELGDISASSYYVSTKNAKYKDIANNVIPKSYKGVDVVNSADYFVFMRDSTEPLTECQSLDILNKPLD